MPSPKGKWELWTRIPSWSDYKPIDAIRAAKSKYKHAKAVRKTAWGKTYVDILVKDKKVKRRKR